MLPRIKNADIAAVFSAAKHKLCRNKDDVRWATARARYICYAIYRVNDEALYHAVDFAAAIIRVRMNGSVMLEDWLCKHGIPIQQQSVGKMQVYRHAWLDQLISEFKGKQGYAKI